MKHFTAFNIILQNCFSFNKSLLTKYSLLIASQVPRNLLLYSLFRVVSQVPRYLSLYSLFRVVSQVSSNLSLYSLFHVIFYCILCFELLYFSILLGRAVCVILLFGESKILKYSSHLIIYHELIRAV